MICEIMMEAAICESARSDVGSLMALPFATENVEQTLCGSHSSQIDCAKQCYPCGMVCTASQL